MKKLVSFLMIALFVVAGSVLLLPKESKAVASFAREQGQSCSLCHWAVPKLNHFGIMYKYNGYRMTPGQGVDAWEFKTVPLTFIIEVEGEVNRGDIEHENDLKVEELELMFATAIGERISVFGEIEYEPDEDEFDSMGRVQVDLTKKGNLNIAAGKLDLDFPFLSHHRRLIKQNHLAESIGFFLRGTAIELNGQVRTQGPISTYTYNAGVLRDEREDGVNRQTKLASYYGTLTLGIKQHSLGLHYRFAKENQGGKDEDVHRFGIAPEFYVGPFILTPGYFYADFDNFGGGADLKADNFLAVLLYKPTNDIVLGLRGDYIDVEQGSLDGDVTAITVNATYYLLPNVYLIAEYRNIAHDDLDLDFGEGGDVTLAPDNRTEEKYRLIFVAVF